MALPTPILTPADFATLQNTLGPMGVLTQMEAERVAQAEQLAQRTQAAGQAAGAAGQAYQEAASAPSPNVAPNEDLINTLTGGLASVLMGSQAPAQRAQQRTRDTRQALLSARADNIQALRDQWKQKAEFAERAGDLEEGIKARQKMEQLSKTFDQLQQTQRLTASAQEAEAGRRARSEEGKLEHERAKELIRLRGAIEKDLAKEKAGLGTGDGADAIDKWATFLDTGQGTMSNVPYKLRSAVVSRLSERGSVVLPPKVRDSVSALSAARSVLSTIEDLSKQVNVAQGRGRFAQGIKSMARGVAQSSEADAIFDETANGLLATLSRATGEKGVLTDRDVKRAKSLVPSRFDSKLVAEAKLKQFKTFLDEMEAKAIRSYTTPASGLGRKAAADPLGIR